MNTPKPAAKRPPVLSFTVKLSKWRCGDASIDKTCRLGNPDTATALRDKGGRHCCLGFAARAAGYTKKLTDVLEPNDLGAVLAGLTYHTEGGYLSNTTFSTEAMTINDCKTTTVKQKQAALIQLGKLHNIKVSFVK